MRTIPNFLRDRGSVFRERSRQSRWRTATYISVLVAGATSSPFSSALADPPLRLAHQRRPCNVGRGFVYSELLLVYNRRLRQPSLPSRNMAYGGYGQGGANVEAVYSLLLAAKLTQTPVHVYGKFPGGAAGTQCEVVFVHLGD